MAENKTNAEEDYAEYLRKLGYSDEIQTRISEVLERIEPNALEENLRRFATERQVSENLSDKLLAAIIETSDVDKEDILELYKLLSRLGEIIESLSLTPSRVVVLFSQIELRLIRDVHYLKKRWKPLAKARLDKWLEIMRERKEQVCLDQMQKMHVGSSLSTRLKDVKDVKECRDTFGLNSSDWQRYEAELERMDTFDILQEQLQSIPDMRGKIAHILEEKTEWERNSSGWDETPVSGKSFGDKCQIEMKKYKQLLKLESEQNQLPADAGTVDENDPEQLKRRVVILLIEELIPKFPKMIPAKQAEFLALLTGMSKKGFEMIVPDHRLASNFDQTQRKASEWLDKLK